MINSNPERSRQEVSEVYYDKIQGIMMMDPDGRKEITVEETA